MHCGVTLKVFINSLVISSSDERDVWKMDLPSYPQCPMMQSPRLFLNQAILVCLLNENGLESSLSCVNKPEEAKQSMTEKAFN